MTFFSDLSARWNRLATDEKVIAGLIIWTFVYLLAQIIRAGLAGLI
jgi:hypothetical protein